MFKILVALKSTQSFKCTVTIDGKGKSINLPQSEGLTFTSKYYRYSLSILKDILLTYKDQQHMIQINEDISELTGEFKFNDVQGLYYIVVIQDIEKPLKLSVRQNESPILRKHETERKLETTSSRKKTKTPNKTDSFLVDSLMEQIKQENLELRQKNIELQQQIEQNQNKHELGNIIKRMVGEQQDMINCCQEKEEKLQDISRKYLELQKIYQELLNKSIKDSQQECLDIQQKMQISSLEQCVITLKLDLSKQQTNCQDYEIIDNLVKQILKHRNIYCAIKDDKIDIKVSQLQQANQMVRLKNGLYKYNEEIITLNFNEKNILMVGDTLFTDYMKRNNRQSKSIKKY